jgi:formylglycine-generating enzyme
MRVDLVAARIKRSRGYWGVMMLKIDSRIVAALAAVSALGASVASAQITIPTVPIGNPGNAADPRTSRGAVAYTYNIGATEVTNAQYAAFLNAKAASDPFNLYNAGMGGSFGGIIRSGTDGSFTYSTVAGRENNPVNFVSFWDTTRFANWLHNGQGSGDTETGAYTLGGVTNPVSSSVIRIAGARWFVASENEWYKAAYFQPASEGGPASNYWLHPTHGLFPTPARANLTSVFGPAVGNTLPVGSFAPNFQGTFDMAGNVTEWNEALSFGSFRGQRGGSFSESDAFTESIRPVFSAPTAESANVGFRVAQLPPPPPCVGDANGDLDRTFADIVEVLANFAATGQPFGPGDANGDGVVNFADVTSVLSVFGQPCS